MTQEDINEAVANHARSIVNIINETPAPYLKMQSIIYWENMMATQFDASASDKFMLQEVLQGKSLKPKLADYGRLSAQEARPMNVSRSSGPLAITISLEAIMANNIKQLTTSSKKVRGFPVLLVAGQSSEGFESCFMVPMAMNEYGEKIVPHVGPISLTRKIEAMEELVTSFLQPFFDSFNQSRINVVRG
jgi:hypothetical protein